MVSSFSIYLAPLWVSAKGIGVAVVLNFNVVNPAVFKHHQGVRMLNGAL